MLKHIKALLDNGALISVELPSGLKMTLAKPKDSKEYVVGEPGNTFHHTAVKEASDTLFGRARLSHMNL